MQITEKYLIEKKRKNIFETIKEFVKNIFTKNKKNKIISHEIFPENIKETFNEKIKYIDKYENERYLKSKIDKNEINISDLTNLEKERMITFYREQINLKEDKLKKIKNRILKLKND